MFRNDLLVICCLALPALARPQVVSFSSSNLPIVVINTQGAEIPDEPKITADMGIIFNGEQSINRLSDPFNHYNGKIGIEIRGQSSQMFPMKSYSVELRDASGNDLSRGLFGFPPEADWVLYAPYTDKTLMRNVMAYALARDLGQWAARCRFVELVLNGNYQGIYVLMEKIKRDPGRVNIAKMTSVDLSGDALTGGYIFSLDKQPNGWYSTYTAPFTTRVVKPYFSYVYPELENIHPAQMAYLKTYVDAFEQSLAAPYFQDPLRGVRKYANLESFIDYFIVNEVSRNVDAYRLSAFFHKDRNGKDSRIFAGPVWDYDLAFRNAEYCQGSNVEGWAYRFNAVCPDDLAALVPFWWYRLVEEDTAFQAALRCRWKTLRQTTLSAVRLNQRIDSIASLLAQAQVRHFQQWPVLGTYVWPNPKPIAGTYAQEIEFLKSWLNARLEWINDHIPNSGNCYDFPADYDKSIIVKVMPNPATTQSYAEVKSRYAQPLTIQVTDMMGRTVARQLVMLYYGINRIPLPVAAWGSGVYLVRFTTSQNETLSIRVVK